MLRRTMDATFLNEVANHPDVRPYLGAPQVPTLDLTQIVQDPGNVVLVNEHGGWVLHPIMPTVYELHTMFLPEGRGRAYFAAAKEALRYVFAQTDCLEIVTKCPDDNGPARMAASLVGFRERFRRDGAWKAWDQDPEAPPQVGLSFQVFSVDDWFVRDKACLAAGREFHAALEEAKVAAGSELPVHPEDDAHDRAVGAAALMIKAGQTDKGVAFYNRWAIFAGYATIAAVSQGVVDVRDAIVEVRDGQMGVLLCRSEQLLPQPA